MDISEISFHCIDEVSDNEAEDLNSDFYRRTNRVNDNRKKVRGHDILWTKKNKIFECKGNGRIPNQTRFERKFYT